MFTVAKPSSTSSTQLKKAVTQKASTLSSKKKTVKQLPALPFIDSVKAFAYRENQDILIIIRDRESGILTQLSSNTSKFNLSILSNDQVKKTHKEAVLDLFQINEEFSQDQVSCDTLSVSTSANTILSSPNISGDCVSSLKFKGKNVGKFDEVCDQLEIGQNLKIGQKQLNNLEQSEILTVEENLSGFNHENKQNDKEEDFFQQFTTTGSYQCSYNSSELDSNEKLYNQVNQQVRVDDDILQQQDSKLNQLQKYYFSTENKLIEPVEECPEGESSEYDEDENRSMIEADFSDPNPMNIGQVMYYSHEPIDTFNRITTSFGSSCQDDSYEPELFLACCDWESVVEEEREEKRQEQLFKQNLKAISDEQNNTASRQMALQSDNFEALTKGKPTVDLVDQYVQLNDCSQDFNEQSQDNQGEFLRPFSQSLVGQKRRMPQESWRPQTYKLQYQESSVCDRKLFEVSQTDNEQEISPFFQ